MIEVSHLTKYYGDKLGVEDLSFSIGRGEIVGLLGPNGAGKSTVMKMMAGHITPTAGSIRVDGYDLAEQPREVCRRMGFLPEIPPLYVEMGVGEYLLFLAQIRGIPRRERARHIEGVMELASVSHVKHRLIKNLSKGYRQRVGLAQALIGTPQILILDEPTVGLDPKQIHQVRSLIRRLSEDHTIILSSHILSEINALCGKVIIISKGRLVKMDSVANLEGGPGGEGGLLVRLQAEPGRAGALLEGLGGAASVTALPARPGDRGGCRFSLTPKAGAALERELFYLCAQEDMPLLELRPAAASLEEVFLSLTADGAGSHEDREEAAV